MAQHIIRIPDFVKVHRLCFTFFLSLNPNISIHNHEKWCVNSIQIYWRSQQLLILRFAKKKVSHFWANFEANINTDPKRNKWTKWTLIRSTPGCPASGNESHVFFSNKKDVNYLSKILKWQFTNKTQRIAFSPNKPHASITVQYNFS